MESHEEVATSSNGIAKGKRTKRQRQCLNYNDDSNNYNTPESQGSRSDICINTKEEEDEEEEDIANCLILLAQGQPRYLCNDSTYSDDRYKVEQKKFTSKKFLEGGYFVYECKTCFKTFPSFQALGGHRASHVKPKKEDSNNNNNNNVLMLVDEARAHHITKKKPRVHECSTCGAEFLSGQALGGHMRRHRTLGGARVHNVDDDSYFHTRLPSTLPFMASMSATMEDNERPPSSVEDQNVCLNLDLNLAAPVEDESSKIQSATKEDI